VYLVGAGPGDPNLMTMAAHQILETADLVIADRLVSKEILTLVKCELRISTKNTKHGDADKAQADMDAWGIKALQEGKTVVRLKNGDPFVFGRGGEEVAIYRKVGITPKIIPGISSSMAAATSWNIPLTLRDVADQFMVCTGHGKHDSFPDIPTYRAKTTIAFLMGVGRLSSLTSDMVQLGYPEDLSVAVIERATMPEQRNVHGTLSTIAGIVKKEGIQAPAIFLVGKVVEASFPGAYEVTYAPQASSTTTGKQLTHIKRQVVGKSLFLVPKNLGISSAILPRAWLASVVFTMLIPFVLTVLMYSEH